MSATGDDMGARLRRAMHGDEDDALARYVADVTAGPAVEVVGEAPWPDTDVTPSLMFHLTCPYDAAPLRFVSTGAPGRWATQAHMTCTRCHRNVIVRVRLDAPDEPTAGTPAPAPVRPR